MSSSTLDTAPNLNRFEISEDLLTEEATEQESELELVCSGRVQNQGHGRSWIVGGISRTIPAAGLLALVVGVILLGLGSPSSPASTARLSHLIRLAETSQSDQDVHVYTSPRTFLCSFRKEAPKGSKANMQKKMKQFKDSLPAVVKSKHVLEHVSIVVLRSTAEVLEQHLIRNEDTGVAFCQEDQPVQIPEKDDMHTNEFNYNNARTCPFQQGDDYHHCAWGLDRIDQPDRQAKLVLPDPADCEGEEKKDLWWHCDLSSWPKSTIRGSGEGSTVYVLDTGVNVDHAEFQGRAHKGYHVDYADDYRILGNYDCSEGNFPTDKSPGCSMDDTPIHGKGHGTHVAGTVIGKTVGVAKEATVVSVKVLDGRGGGTEAGIVYGINWVIDQHVMKQNKKNIMSLSLGGWTRQWPSAMDHAVSSANEAGIIAVVAAGNDGTKISTRKGGAKPTPACATGAVTVGATDIADNMASFSNYGPCVDIFAPGHRIASAWHSTAGICEPFDGSKPDCKYDNEHPLVPWWITEMSGTSMAAPHVSGVAAVLWSLDPADDSDAVKAQLLEQSVLQLGFRRLREASDVSNFEHDHLRSRKLKPGRGGGGGGGGSSKGTWIGPLA
eukprot:TRINITY_DN32363_c0_g1_i1.p1 TRINITY_DN32363_c0_g1~~TRINITY_DN32363_c0_g1_i1.p1  ORF type:complete len:609 (+),score=88.16 TRINITY_DN32363_c0_g1_i1:62-1888(+)